MEPHLDPGGIVPSTFISSPKPQCRLPTQLRCGEPHQTPITPSLLNLGQIICSIIRHKYQRFQGTFGMLRGWRVITCNFIEIVIQKLTMYRPQNQSRFYESSYHQENPFFRETITIIDECTKLMKEDRIFLRNKIKDYLKELKENRQKEDDWENEQMQILLQIFVEGNKKKSLSKIQKGDKVMDWLQIKLRKFIDNNKKERHKKEVESFRKIKGLNPKKQMQSNINFERSLQKSRQFSGYNGQRFNEQLNKLQFNLEPRKKTTLPKYSLSKSNEKSPSQSRKVSQKQPFSNVSFYKQFDYLKKAGSKEKQQPVRQTSSSLLKNKYLYHESRPISSQLSKFNKSLEHNRPAERSKDKTINQNISKLDEQFLKNKQIRQNPKQNQLSKQQIDKLALLFSNQLNSQQQKERNAFKAVQSHFRHPQKNMKPMRDITIPSKKLPSEPSFDRDALILDNPTRYDVSNKKIQEMLRSSQEILASYEKQHQGLKYQPIDALPIPHEITIPKVSSNEDLFTPPDFLAECRKYMFSSNKKKTEDDVLPSQSDERYNEPYKQTTFSDILNESKQKTLQKIYRGNQLGINESISENVSANLSTNKPESEVHFQYRNVSITSVQSLLLQIFKLSYKRTLDKFQLGQIMSKCNKETQQSFQQCCDKLNQQSSHQRQKLSFDFVTTVKFFYNQKKILQPNKDYFCIFLNRILDIRKKEYIDEDDIHSFFESLESSQLDESILQSIETYLQSVFKKGCEVEGGNIATFWSLYYLELKSDLNFLNLKQHLNKFQFELEQSIDQ